MIEEFLDESESISNFFFEKDKKVNKLLSSIGLNAFYKMVIYDNFVHADCHGGNILVSKVNKK